MKNKRAVWLPILMLMVFVPAVRAQATAAPAPAPAAAKPHKKAAPSPADTTRDKNIKEYIELLRANVRQDKAEMMGAMMVLSAAEAAKFWPIYADYDAELTKVNDLRVANIEEYSRTYNDMTDAKADELIKNSLQFQVQRGELLAKYYGRVKDSLGAITAARFIQVEHQLLLIIDLQIAASLPIVGSGS
jgi:hypothetical protein